MLQEQVIEEIRQIPPNKLIDVYRLVHDFRLGLLTYKQTPHKTVDEVFGKLHKPGQKTVSIEEMNSAISKRMQDKFK